MVDESGKRCIVNSTDNTTFRVRNRNFFPKNFWKPVIVKSEYEKEGEGGIAKDSKKKSF